jgi:hypothetical protein
MRVKWFFELGMMLVLAVVGAQANKGQQMSATASNHSVVLTWTASTDGAANPTLGYNVYRSSSTGTEDGTTAINGTTLVGVGCSTACTYTDSNVSVGQTYFYVLRSSLGGVESVDSNEASAKMVPAAPSGLAAKAQ